MIFISHNYKDKPIVERFALELSQIYGMDNVFYDSWSIQPGDGIIEKMNKGLEKCKFFFFFVSKESLQSKMVTMEWQNAIMMAAEDGVKLIPVRLDGSIMPVILKQTLYLDLFTNGLEVTLTQAKDLIEDRNIYRRDTAEFSNLIAHVQKTSNTITIDIVAKHYMEPRSTYCVLLSNNKTEAKVTVKSSGMFHHNYIEKPIESSEYQNNGFIVSIDQATIPNFPFEIEVVKTSEVNLHLLGVLHQVSPSEWINIPIKVLGML